MTLTKQQAETDGVTSIEEGKYLTWCMEFKNRNNNNIKKQEILDFIFNTVDGRVNPVDLKNADIYVIVEVYRDLLMIGVVPHYKELKKFNLQQLIKGDAAEDGSDRSEGGERPPTKVVKLADLIGKRKREAAGEVEEVQAETKAEEEVSSSESDHE